MLHLTRRRILPALLCASALLAVGLEQAAAADQPRCAPKGAKTVRASAETRVYRLNEQKYACSLRTGHVKRLDRKEDSTAYIYDVRGRYVAYEIYVTTRDRSYIAVRSVDARSGRMIVNTDAFTGARRIERSVEAASALQLLTGGSVAWISRTSVDDVNREVRYADAVQSDRVLDAGVDIDPDSLAVTAGYVYWTAAGQAQVTRLP